MSSSLGVSTIFITHLSPTSPGLAYLEYGQLLRSRLKKQYYKHNEGVFEQGIVHVSTLEASYLIYLMRHDMLIRVNKLSHARDERRV